jgi:hypothetical protein
MTREYNLQAAVGRIILRRILGRARSADRDQCRLVLPGPVRCRLAHMAATPVPAIQVDRPSECQQLPEVVRQKTS